MFFAFLQQSANPLLGFLPLFLIFAIFWFLLFMPMQRQKKQTREMLANLQTGNVVQTAGGIIGAIISMNENDDTLILRVKPDNVKIQVARNSVSGIVADK